MCRCREKPGQVHNRLDGFLCPRSRGDSDDSEDFYDFDDFFLVGFVSVSASTKRSHECWPAATGGGMATEAIHRQASTSPVRPSLTAMVTLQPPASPSSSNASVRKKLVGLWSYFYIYYYSVYIFSDSFLGEKGGI